MKAGVQQLWNQLKNGNSCEASRVDLSPWPPMQNRGLAYQSLHSLPLVWIAHHFLRCLLWKKLKKPENLEWPLRMNFSVQSSSDAFQVSWRPTFLTLPNMQKILKWDCTQAKWSEWPDAAESFFPSNAFMAFARSLHTFNRSKKMNCKLSCKAGNGHIHSPVSSPIENQTTNKANKQKKHKTTTKPKPQSTEKWDRYHLWDIRRTMTSCVSSWVWPPKKKQNKDDTEQHKGAMQEGDRSNKAQCGNRRSPQPGSQRSQRAAIQA